MHEKRKLDLQPLIRFFDVLPESGDKELALLKTHLLVEEVLTKIICKSMKNEKYVYESKLTFNQKCMLARAINGLDHVLWIWQALRLLNRARNELSHNLTSVELNQKLGVFIRHVSAHNSKLFGIESSERFTEFHMAAFATYMPLAVHANFDPANVRLSTVLNP